MTAQSPDKDRPADHQSVSIYVGVAIFAGVAIVMFHDYRWTSTLWAGACLGLGATVGFLFGIPRTIQSDGSAPQAYAQKVNTNLEQISDWLTKILVGLGLTQLSQIPFTLQQAAGYIAEGIGNTPQQRVFAYALMLYFSIVGFIGGYLLTRIFLPRILYVAESGLGIQQTVALENLANPSRPVSGPTSLAVAADDRTRVARAGDIVKVTTEILGAYTDLEKKASTEVLERHIAQLEPSKDQFPLFRMLYITLGRLYRWTGNLTKAIDTLSEFLQHKEMDGSRTDKDAGAALYNRACYYALQLATASPNEAADRKRQAINDLREAIGCLDEYRVTAKSDPDFESLRGEGDFKKLVGD